MASNRPKRNRNPGYAESRNDYAPSLAHRAATSEAQNLMQQAVQAAGNSTRNGQELVRKTILFFFQLLLLLLILYFVYELSC